MDVQFYASSSNRNYVGDFIADLPVKARKKVVRQLELLEKHGINFMTHAGLMTKLEGYGMYEFTIDFNKVRYRILCVIRQATCWLLHAFVKKSNHTPSREIKTALQRSKNLDLIGNLAVT